jgi:hypothetical protein
LARVCRVFIHYDKNAILAIFEHLFGIKKTSNLALENFALRQQLAEKGGKKASDSQPGSSFLNLAFSILEELAKIFDHCQTRNCHSMAWNGFQFRLSRPLIIPACWNHL